MVKVSDFIFSFIADLGVRHVFVISGGGNMHLVDSLGRNKKLRYVCNHHEQASAIAAEAYGRISGGLGVCVVTTGPAGTNTFTGVLGAWNDSIPVLFISGQVKRADLAKDPDIRQLGVQEARIVEMVKPITKYAVTVMSPQEIKFHLKKAIFLAQNGRPGPVWIDIPLDVQGSLVDENQLLDFNEKKEFPKSKNNLLLNKQVGEVFKFLQNSSRPVIVAGHGIRMAKAKKEFLELVSRLKAPVLTTMSATDLISDSSKFFVGRFGAFGDRAGNFAVQNSDLIITIGARNHMQNIGYNFELFAREAKKVVIDIDPAELRKKTLKPDLPILSDAKAFILEMLKLANKSKTPNISSWRAKCSEWRRKYPVLLVGHKKNNKYVNSYFFIDALSGALSSQEVILTGNGAAETCTLQAIKIKDGQKYHVNIGCASMGWDVPAAIGACFANNQKRVILITGDGSIMMNLQELQTICHYRLPVKIFLLNNQGYLSIKNTQNSYFAGRFVASEKFSGVSFPNFKKIASAFNVKYVEMRTNADVKNKIRQTLKSHGPVICEINMDPNQELFPKIISVKKPDGSMVSKPLEDMYPFLDRKEFLSNMIIKPVNVEVD